jgi:tetratricopeptide (TPR) repeat protein
MTPAPTKGPAPDTLNRRVLVYLLAGAIVLGGGWYLAHRLQVRRNAASLLSQADAAETQQRPDRAARYLRMYVGYRPEDVDARVRYGQLLDRMARSDRNRADVIAVYEQVLIRDPGRSDTRRRVTELLLASGQWDDAAQHLKLLFDQVKPPDAELRELAGRAAEGRGEYARAAGYYRAAVADAPTRVDAHLQLARLLRDRLSQPVQADDALAAMVAANESSAQAYARRAQFRMEKPLPAGGLGEVTGDVTKALALAPKDPEVLLIAADVLGRTPGGADQARAHLRDVIALRPRAAAAYETLARVELDAGKSQAAMAALRQGLDKIPDHPGLLWNLTHLTIQYGDAARAEPMIVGLEKLETPAPRLEFLRGSLLVREGKWAEAKQKLEAARPLLVESRDLTIQTDILLARCLDGLADLPAQVLTCRRALALDPVQGGVRLQLATALVQLGRIDEAAEECQRLATLPNPPASGWLLTARLAVRRTLRLPAGQRRWDLIDAALQKADEGGADATEVTLLRASVLVARRDFAAARSVLETARGKNPKADELWVASVDLALQAGDRPHAEKVLAAAEPALGDGAGLRFARLRLALDLPDSEVGKALAALEAGNDRFPLRDRTRFLASLAEAHYKFRRLADARRLWEEVARLSPGQLTPWLRVFDIALEGDDQPAMDHALAAIRQAERPDGPAAKFAEARRLIWLARRGDAGAAGRAEPLLAAVAKQQPGSSQVYLCLGQVSETQGDEERALERYLRAVELGDNHPDLIGRVVRLLQDRRRFTDAELVLQKLPEQEAVSPDLKKLVVEQSLRSGNHNRALELARQAVRSDKKDHRDYVWLGLVLWAAAQQADLTHAQRRATEQEAEDTLNEAVKVSPSAPEGWVALVQHLARTGRAGKATETIETARARIDPKEGPLALAQCYAAVNQPQKAKEEFAKALAARPDDVVTLRVAADFHLRVDDLAQAENCLRRLIEGKGRSPAVVSWARSVLAVVLASHADPRKSREALVLVGLIEGAKAEDDAPGGSAQQERARAAVLALQPDPVQQQRAIAVLERMNARQMLSPEDRFLLVQLYERAGDWERAREAVLPLVNPRDNPRVLGYYTDALLRHGLPDEAQRWADALERIEPKSVRTVSLKARLLAARGKPAEAATMLRHLAETQDARTTLLIAQLLEELSLGAEAEGLYRRAAGSGDIPDGVPILVRYLGRQKRTAEALDASAPVWATNPGVAAEVCLAALHAGRPDAAQIIRVEQWLKAAVRQTPGATTLVLAQADLADLKGDYPAAEALYRGVLQKEPGNLVALNNLAGLLALRGGTGDEPVILATRAVEVGGPIPELLDTRGVALLAAGRALPALDDFKQAAARPVGDRKVRFAILFHLAQAQHRAGNMGEARKAWKDAQETRAGVDDLHPLERKTYEQLTTEMGRP